jgi:putative ATP-binding cassette transporter
MAGGLLTAVLSAIIFIGVLWNVGGDLDLWIFGHQLTVPKYLVMTVAAYSGLLTIGMAVIGRRMVHAIAEKNAAEAQFRSVGGNLRERRPAELATGPSSHRQLSDVFAIVIARWRSLCFQFMRTTVVSQGNLLTAPVMGWILCAPKYLGGTMSLGEVAQVVSAFVIVQTALNWLVDNYAGLAECLSSVNRVAALLLALDESEVDGSLSHEACRDTNVQIGDGSSR